MSPGAPFEWTAAIRFLREGRMQSLFIITGVSIGVAVIVFMSAMLSGLQANFISRVLTSQSHIQLVPPEETARPLRTGQGMIAGAIVQRPAQRVRSIDQWQTLCQVLGQWPGVTVVAPVVSASALAVRGEASRSISLTGVDPGQYFRIVRIPDFIVSGDAVVSSDEIVIGSDLAQELGVAIGDKISIVPATGEARLLVIRGIFDLGNRAANLRSTFVALRTAQALANLSGGVTSIELAVGDVYAAEEIAARVQSSTGIRADSWIRTNAQFFTAVRAQSSANTIIRLFVGVSVAFGIASVLVVSVIQRSTDIGILRAMGTTRGQILRVFLLQGGLLGLAGSVIGTGMGSGALFVWHARMRQADGSELFPLILEPGLLFSAMLLASLTGVAAAAIPALRAAQLDPVEAIRG